jgi:hypothetical protein
VTARPVTRLDDVYDTRFCDGTATEVWRDSQPYVIGVCPGSCAHRIAPVEGEPWPEEHESWAAALSWLIAGGAGRYERVWRVA